MDTPESGPESTGGTSGISGISGTGRAGYGDGGHAASSAEDTTATGADPVDVEHRKRDILTDVAAGRLDPDEASRLLDQLGIGTVGSGSGVSSTGGAAAKTAAGAATIGPETHAAAGDPNDADGANDAVDRADSADSADAAESGRAAGAHRDDAGGQSTAATAAGSADDDPAGSTGSTDTNVADPWAAETDDVTSPPPRRTGHNQRATTAERAAPSSPIAGVADGSAGTSGASGPGGGATSREQEQQPGNGAIAHPDQTAVERLRIRALGRRVRVIGEPFVSTVAIDGPHVVRTEDDTLVVTSEGEIGASIDGFTLLRTRSLRDVQEQVFDLGRELSVRVNPALAVEVETTAGSLNAERLPKLEHVRVTAGSARLRDVTGPIDLLVQAGSATVEGALTKGTSRLRAESGSLQLQLLAGSDVRIRPDAQLGRIAWERDTGDSERVFGAGTAHLDLEVVMGNIQVKEAT